MNDGAAAVVVASDEWAEANGREPLATVLAYGTVADDFPYLARTPARPPRALDKLGRSADEIDLWEINEAFASVALNSLRMLGVSEDDVNVNGGAIALGHPIGASGAGSSGRSFTSSAVEAAASAAPQSAVAAAKDAIVLEVNGG